jgi:hypothetical protein
VTIANLPSFHVGREIGSFARPTSENLTLSRSLGPIGSFSSRAPVGVARADRGPRAGLAGRSGYPSSPP